MTEKKILFIFSIFAVFGLGVALGMQLIECKICPPEDVDFELFWEAWHKLEEKFPDPEKLNVQERIYGAISGMVKSIGDPYTVFFNPQETEEFLEEAEGVFEGIGAEIGIKEDQLRIVAPLEGTPAEKAGLLPGDKILRIDGKDTFDLTIEEAVKLIRGPKGTEVVLTIFREGWREIKDITIIRSTIQIPSLKWVLLEDDIAHLTIYQFFERAHSDFHKLANEILASPAKKIILDLRNNPGGYLEAVQDIAGWFLETGSVVAIEDFGPEKEQGFYKALGNERLVDYPIVVLINQGSASASEILAGALRDNRNVLLVGETSFGKGSIQELETLKDDSSLKITIANWLTPNGNLIAGEGLDPDVKVEMTQEDYENDRDPQLEKAIEIIKDL